MSKNAIAKLTRLLKMKFWFGGEAIYPFVHPFNKVQNALMIYLDGCCQWKFKVHKNGKLRVMRIYSARSLNLGLKPLQTITVDELYVRIARCNNDYAPTIMQLTSPVPVPINMAELREVEMLRRTCNQYALPLKPELKFV